MFLGTMFNTFISRKYLVIVFERRLSIYFNLLVRERVICVVWLGGMVGGHTTVADFTKLHLPHHCLHNNFGPDAHNNYLYNIHWKTILTISFL